MAKIKQENDSSTSDAQKIAALENEMQQLRHLVEQQSDQLAKQQKWLQLIQFSWLTFFFVVFNLILAGVFIAVFMKDKGPQDLYLMVTATPMKAKFVSERVRVKMTMEDLTACLVEAFWGKS
ncbi:hypothetical protein ACHAWO_010618 [Cyclotella atomus]|uniref:Uncharacterized protein n=1 Tax=Cyclotella atomus TaxID=382360 RepID=A0ABD3MZZ1_9STRA